MPDITLALLPSPMVIDFPSVFEVAGALDFLGASRDTSPPTVVDNPSSRTITVTDPAGIRRVMLWIIMGGRWELVFDGDGFGPGYGGSSRTAVAGGYTFQIDRVGGFPEEPVIKGRAWDNAGNEV